MSWWNDIVGRGGGGNGTNGRSAVDDSGGYAESDSVGVRCETQGEGEAYFISLLAYLISLVQKDPEPLILYFFDSEDVAKRTLAEVSRMAIAGDGGKLICTEVLTFGVFPAVETGDAPTWGALLAGKSLCHDLRSEAKESFQKHGGRTRREEEPARSTPSTRTKRSGPGRVTFTHERRDIVAGAPATYRHHEGPDRASALAWLKQQPVDKRSYFAQGHDKIAAFARAVERGDGQRICAELIATYGKLEEVLFLAGPFRARALLVFEGGVGVRVGTDSFIPILTFGHQGPGATTFSALLSAAGFLETDATVISPPLRLRRDGTRVSGERQEGHMSWEDGTFTEMAI